MMRGRAGIMTSFVAMPLYYKFSSLVITYMTEYVLHDVLVFSIFSLKWYVIIMFSFCDVCGSFRCFDQSNVVDGCDNVNLFHV